MLGYKTFYSKNKRGTSLIILQNIGEPYQMFKSGITSRYYMGNIINWFYYGLKCCFQLSLKRVSVALMKLTRGWEQKNREIIHWFSKVLTPVLGDGFMIPVFHYYDYCNSGHIPYYMDLVGKYTWVRKNSGGGNWDRGKIKN